MLYRFRLLSGLALLSFFSTTASFTAAETIRIPLGQQTMSQQGMSQQEQAGLPHTGQTKEQVSENHGEPGQRSGPTGEPAIYRWDYEGFAVYFENNRVIHAVVKFVPKVASPEVTSGTAEED